MSARRADWTPADNALVEELAQAEARRNFFAYRRYIRGSTLITGWWIRETAQHLQAFYDRYIAGERPKLLLLAPPQHGKSTMMVDFLSWVSGKNPHTKSMFTSYSDALGVRANYGLQRIYDDARFQATFPELKMPQPNDIGSRNSELLDYLGYEGSFRNTTVLGQCTGFALDFGAVDDPIKGRKEAQSETTREATWNWFTDDFFTRFSEHAALLMIMTRWHLDDPSGRFIDRFPGVQVLEYPAIAVHDETHRKAGEPLFPEFKSKALLEERRQLLTRSSWESLYQQKPIIVGGGMFPVAKFTLQQALPARGQIRRACRYWDKAGTEDDGAFTAGTLMLLLADDTLVVADVRRGQWGAFERENVIKMTTELDAREYEGTPYYVVLEQEPGSGGKESAERSIRMLRGYNASADKVTGDKIIRAEPYAAQVQAGNIAVFHGNFTRAFLDEHEVFPNGPFKDQVDAAAGAFTKLTLGTRYDTSGRWMND
jgi:predicted phage terminase large subunit-like protein